MGVLGPEIGFRIFGLGVLLGALLGVGLAGAAAFASATGRDWRATALKAALIPLVVTLAIVIPQLANPGARVVLNDVSTDLEDPPFFLPDVAAGTTASQGPPPELRALQRRSYPEIAPIHSSLPPAEAWPRALELAKRMERWRVTDLEESRGIIQAVALSRIFRFVDDVVIRIRPEDGGSRIDLRSRSRVGRGDLGANAARVIEFQRRFLEEESGS